MTKRVNEEIVEIRLETSQESELTTGAPGCDARSRHEQAGKTPPIPPTSQSAKCGIRRVVPPDHEAPGEQMQRRLQELEVADVHMRRERTKRPRRQGGTTGHETSDNVHTLAEALGNKASQREWCPQGCGASASHGRASTRTPKQQRPTHTQQVEKGRSSEDRAQVTTHTQSVETREAQRSQQVATRSGTSNFPRAERGPVAMQLSDDRQNRDECLHGRTQLWASATRQLMSQEDACVNRRHRKPRHTYALDSNVKSESSRRRKIAECTLTVQGEARAAAMK